MSSVFTEPVPDGKKPDGKNFTYNFSCYRKLTGTSTLILYQRVWLLVAKGGKFC